ncbi:MAG: hypothetical protein VKJ46_03735 [Leptolyngbyaceae bacterium]|nr:hypothetical protein [Leptolyngbyaceae bacterium]
MSELDLACSSWSPGSGNSAQSWEQERQSLLVEITQVRSLDRERVERIANLEQALDQALNSLKELGLQVRDQQILETQLAATEEFSHIQQQAITKLKLQLVHQQQTLEAQRQENLDLESQIYIGQRQIENLEAHVQARQQQIAEQTIAIASLTHELATTHVKIEELETQVAKHVMRQARLQQAGQELEAERDRYLSRIAELEQQTAEMQEQILKQARQASEYETAVQHWKDRHLMNQHQSLELKDLLEQKLTESLSPTTSGSSSTVAVVLAELLTAFDLTLIPDSGEAVSPDMGSPPLNNPVKIELSTFLARRRTDKP